MTDLMPRSVFCFQPCCAIQSKEDHHAHDKPTRTLRDPHRGGQSQPPPVEQPWDLVPALHGTPDPIHEGADSQVIGDQGPGNSACPQGHIFCPYCRLARSSLATFQADPAATAACGSNATITSEPIESARRRPRCSRRTQGPSRETRP